MPVDFGEVARAGQLHWLTAALWIATDVAPGLDAEALRRRLGALASPLRERDLTSAAPERQAKELVDHLYRGEGFRGNQADYEDPANSLLDQVLERRLGIPISLALVFVEVAQRLGIDAVGVGFPGHFLVKIQDQRRIAGIDRSVLVDPFDGQLLEHRDLELLAERATGDSEVQDSWLQPSRVEEVVLRMLNNLRAAYARRGDFARLLIVLNRMCELVPESAALLRDRGKLQAKLGAPHAALADLESYLNVMPRASDVQDVQQLIDDLSERLHRQPHDALN